jgi:pimeloyl-ACP methyl ester carboxylesterase
MIMTAQRPPFSALDAANGLQPSLRHVTCPGASRTDAQTHRMAYWHWGDAANPRVLVCVHGLSRQGRDFDTLAQALSRQYQVICPDIVGRGHSDWLADAKGYQLLTYASDMVVLMQQLRQSLGVPIDKELPIDWVGTSMGGLIGLAFSSLPPEVSGVRLRRFVLNDVGPRLRVEALLRIGDYLGRPMRFATEQQAVDYLWSISTGFGPHTPEQWLSLSRPLLRPAPDGQGLVLHYDLAIAEPFKGFTADSAASGEAAVWQIYDAITAETLLLRGANSDLLDADTAREMSVRGPRARLVEFAGVGHAPTLVAPQQTQAVSEFLLA